MIFLKSAISIFRKRKFGNITSIIQIIAVILVTSIMISSICFRYEKYTPFSDYFEQNGLFVRAGWGMNLEPDTRNLSDGIENDDVKDLFSGVKDVLATHYVECYLPNNSLNNFTYSANVWSYDDEIIKRYSPELKDGHWFDEDDLSDNITIKTVVSENDYGWNTGDKIPITFVCNSEFTIDVEIIGIFKNSEKIIGGNYQQGNNDFNDFYYSFDSDFEGTPCILLSYSQLKLFSDNNEIEHIYQPIMSALVTYDSSVKNSQIESDITQWSKYEAEASYNLNQLVSNSKTYLYEQVYNLLPIILLLILLIVASCISMSSLSTESNLKNYAIYYITGLQWKQCVFINLTQSAIISAISFILSFIAILVVKATPFSNDIAIILNSYTILSMIVLIILYMIISMIMPIIIIGKNTPKQILTR